jgi:acyl carrier protein
MNDKKTIDEIRNVSRRFLMENYLFGYEENELENDTSIMDMGVLDSTGIIELVVFIESEYNIEIQNSEIIPENLDSINCICQFVLNKLYAA